MLPLMEIQLKDLNDIMPTIIVKMNIINLFLDKKWDGIGELNKQIANNI